MYIWSIALCRSERERKRLHIFEMWLLYTIKNSVRREKLVEDNGEPQKMLRQLRRHDSFARSIIERVIERKKGSWRPRRSYLDKIKESVVSGTLKLERWTGMFGDWSTDKSQTKRKMIWPDYTDDSKYRSGQFSCSTYVWIYIVRVT